jgi:hypothetical protein
VSVGDAGFADDQAPSRADCRDSDADGACTLPTDAAAQWAAVLRVAAEATHAEGGSEGEGDGQARVAGQHDPRLVAAATRGAAYATAAGAVGAAGDDAAASLLAVLRWAARRDGDGEKPICG